MQGFRLSLGHFPKFSVPSIFGGLPCLFFWYPKTLGILDFVVAFVPEVT